MKRSRKRSQAPLMQVTEEMVKQVDVLADEFTEQMIDLPITDFCKLIENNNVGDLRIKRLYLEQKMFELDEMCAQILDVNNLAKANLTREEALTIGQLFAVVAKIEAKRGVIDYLLLKRRIAGEE